MVLSNFIRRNHGKRKASKVIESHSHKKYFSAPESSQAAVASSLVFDINEESLAAHSSPVVQLNLSNSNEEWFPKEFLHRSGSPFKSLHRTHNVQEDLAQETRARTSPVPSLSHSESASSGIASRKKSIPAPIMIPDHPIPNIQIGHSAVPIRALPTPPDANDNSNHPSPLVSEELSSISGTTLARDLIGSSFALSSSEHCSSRHRSGVARQDSATLPRGSLFLSNSRSSSPIPPVPPVPANLVAASPDSNYPSTGRSVASTESEYPMSESCITSPEMANSAVFPRRISRIQETPSPDSLASNKSPLLSTIKPQRKGGPVLIRTRVPKDGLFDVPNTPVEPLPIISQEAPLHSSREESILLSSDDHSLDEFNFMPPEPLILFASPKSDSSASYISPTVPLTKRSDTKGKRRAGGLHLVQNGSKFSLADSAFASQQAHSIPSPSVSELDYGELFNYDMTVSPGTSLSSSSASAGYQTFPETPVALSPLGSAGYPLFSRSDSQMLRRRISSMRSTRRGSGKLSYVKSMRRQVGNKDGGAATLRRQSPLLPMQEIPSLKDAEPDLPLSVPVEDDAVIPEDETSLLTVNKEESQRTGDLLTTDRPHPLARVSSSSSYVLEEEALQALADCSPSSLPSITIAGVDPSTDLTTIPISDTDPSVQSPASAPLPQSTSVSSSNSPALTVGSTALSLSTSTSISQSEPSKLLLSPPTAPFGGSSFLPSVSPSSSSDESLSRTNSPTVAISSSVAPYELPSQSPSPSFVPPPPYHIVVSERTAHQASSTWTPSLSRMPSGEPGYLHSRQASNSSLASGCARTGGRSRPFGPRKPSGPGQVPGPLFPGIRGRNGSTSSVGSVDPAGSPAFPWRKLYSAASKPPPKFHAPPPKWRGLTLEAAQWTFTSAQLQQIVSEAIRQSSEGSALRFLLPDMLEGEIADEMQRLEMQHMDVKAQYKTLSRQRWVLMGALAGYIEGAQQSDVTGAASTLEELAEVLVTLDSLADKMHDTALQMAQLKSLRDVHNTSALALAVRKINDLFVRQLAEKEQLQEQVNALRTERDEAWKHAEEIAQDYDTLNDRVSESTCGDGKAFNGDASSATGSKRSTQVMAKRKSSIRQSQAGLRSRSRSRHRAGRSPSDATRPSSLALGDIPPVPRLPVNPLMSSSTMTLPSGMSFGSAYSGTPATSATLALAEAQREVYEMLGLSLPPSQASSRRRTLSNSAVLRPPSPKSRPASESLGVRTRVVRRVRSRQEWGRATRSMVLDDHYYVRPLATAHG